MSVSLDVRRFLKNRRDRAVGSILGYAEAEFRPSMSDAQWQKFRQVVLDAANSYHDTVLDIVKTDDSVRNDYLIGLLERVDQKLDQNLGHEDTPSATASGN